MGVTSECHVPDKIGLRGTSEPGIFAELIPALGKQAQILVGVCGFEVSLIYIKSSKRAKTT